MMRGLEALLMRLGAANAIEGAIALTIEDSARKAMDIARALAPVGEGKRREKRLIDSFSYEAQGMRGEMRVENPHAAYVEFGTGRRGAAGGHAGMDYDTDWPGMAAQPYMQPAAQLIRAEHPGRMAEAVSAVLRGRK